MTTTRPNAVDGEWHEWHPRLPDPRRRTPDRRLRVRHGNVAPDLAQDPAPAVVPVDSIVLWGGASATMFIAGLVSIVGLLAARSLPGVDLITPHGNGAYRAVTPWQLTAGAIFAALVAAVLAHLLLLLTPRPCLFFRSIALLTTAMMAVWPYTTDVAAGTKVATSAVYAAIGISVTLLLTVVTRHVRTGFRP